jgi:hypothetical protein
MSIQRPTSKFAASIFADLPLQVCSRFSLRHTMKLRTLTTSCRTGKGCCYGKCLTVADLQHNVVSLTYQVRESQELLTEFDQVTAKKDMFELDLVQ